LVLLQLVHLFITLITPVKEHESQLSLLGIDICYYHSSSVLAPSKSLSAHRVHTVYPLFFLEDSNYPIAVPLY